MRWLYLLILAAAASTAWAEEPAGLIVESVNPDSLAAKAGVQVGDRLLEYDGKPLLSPCAWVAAWENVFCRTEVVLRFQRGKELRAVTMPLGWPGVTAASPELPAEARELTKGGTAAMRARRIEEAVPKLKAAAEAADKAGYEAGASWRYRCLGIEYRGEGRWKEAREVLLRAWALIRGKGDGAGESRLLGLLAECAEALSDPAEAHKWYGQKLEVDLAVGYLVWAAADFESLSTIALLQGNTGAAEDYHARALGLYENLPCDSPDFARALAALSRLSQSRGAPKAAQDYYARACALLEGAPRASVGVALGFSAVGEIARGHGDLYAALEHHTRAVAILEDVVPDSVDLARALTSLASVTRLRGDLPAARLHLARALAIGERQGAHPTDVAPTLGLLGRVSLESGDLQTAQDCFARALAVWEKYTPHRLEAASSLNDLGRVALLRGDLAAAEDYHTRALAIGEDLAPRSLDVAESLGNLGRVACQQGDLRRATDCHAQALAIQEQLAPDSAEAALSYSSLGWLALSEGHPREALRRFSKAVQVLEAQRRAIATPEARSLFLQRYLSPYIGLLRCYLELRNLPQAFEVVERARARDLVELLAERTVDFSADAPAQLLMKGEELDSKRTAAYSQLSKCDPSREPERVQQLRVEVEAIATEQRQLTEAIRKASPRYAALQYPQALGLKDAEAALDPGTLLLTYVVDTDQTYLFSVTRTAVRLHRIRASDYELRTRVAEFRKALASPRGRTQQRGRELYELLIRPAQAEVSRAKRVLLCPDGPLHTLPFGALVSREARGGGQNGVGSGRRPVRYFIEDKPLHTIVSMTVYAELRGNLHPSTHSPLHHVSLLALGDPVYDSTSERAKKVAGEFATRGATLTPLPNSREEVEAIKRLYGPTAAIRVGPEATESAVKTDGAGAKMVHLACHGVLDDRDPLGSALALTPEADKEDGLLRAYEVMEKLRLNAGLVVLSACQSGLGQETKNEGIVGMTRAFQYAGARSVVVSLWNVADESTAELMTEFYRHLKAGKPKDEALRAAQLSFLHPNPKPQTRNRKSFSHPFYWAPFVLVGDWR